MIAADIPVHADKTSLWTNTVHQNVKKYDYILSVRKLAYRATILLREEV